MRWLARVGLVFSVLAVWAGAVLTRNVPEYHYDRYGLSSAPNHLLVLAVVILWIFAIVLAIAAIVCLIAYLWDFAFEENPE